MIKRVLIYLTATILLLYGLHFFVLCGLQKNKHGIFNKYNTLFLANNTYNTLVLGSSRAEMHFDAPLFDSITGLSTYNAGLSGATTRMAYIVFKAYLVNSQIPKTVFLDCDFHRNHLNTDTIKNFPRFFPYLSNQTLYSELKKIDPCFFQFKYNPLYSLPFMGINYLNPSLHGWFNKTGVYDLSYKNGFFKNTILDNYGHFNPHIRYRKGYVTKETHQYLDSMILLCKQNNIRLILTISPAYITTQQEVTNKTQVVNEYKEIAVNNNIDFYNFSDDTTIIDHKTYFEDSYHMMYSGARIYTKKLTEKIEYKNSIK